MDMCKRRHFTPHQSPCGSSLKGQQDGFGPAAGLNFVSPSQETEMELNFWLSKARPGWPGVESKGDEEVECRIFIFLDLS